MRSVLSPILAPHVPASRLSKVLDALSRVFEKHIRFEKDASVQVHLWQDLVSIFNAHHLPFSVQLPLYNLCFGKRKEADGPPIVWLPKQTHSTNIAKFMKKKGFPSFPTFHIWSVEHKNGFYLETLASMGTLSKKECSSLVALDEKSDPEDPHWFPKKKFDIVSMCLCAHKKKKAIVYRREGEKRLQSLTYGQLDRLVHQVAHGLVREGFCPGDFIAIDMPMTPESVAIYLGIIRAGCIVVSVADSFTAPEIRKRMEIVKAKGIFTVDSFIRAGKSIDMYSKVKEATSKKTLVVCTSSKTKLRAADVRWETFLGEEKAGRTLSHGADPQTVTNVLFSSGTTGEPKAIPWTTLTPLKAAIDSYYHHDIHADDVLCWPTNLGWMMGPWLIYATFMHGATMALHVGTAANDDFGRFVKEAKVTMLGTVPSLVKIWRQSACMEQCDWSSLRMFSSTGECSNPMDYLYLLSLAHYRVPVIEYCGGTEIGGGFITGTLVQPSSPSTFTTPALGMDIKILREDGKACKECEPGEAFLVPPSLGLSQTLLNRDHHSVYYDSCPKGPAGEVLRRHGDALERLPNGFYRHHGRVDDTMNLGGIKVSSAELETALNRHPMVLESAAIAVPESGGGIDLLVVYVVLRDKKAKTDTLKEELQRLLRDTLNPLFRIHELLFMDILPRTASNKVMRRVLRDEYVEKRNTKEKKKSVTR